MKILSRIKTIIKASRVERATYVPLAVIAGSSFTNTFNIYTLILIIVGVLIYSIGGLINAKKDNDYNLSKFEYYFSLCFILILSIILSLTNYKILILMSIAVFLAFVYNSYGRKIIYGDIIVASITHIFIPFIGSIWLSGINPLNFLPEATLPVTSFILFVNVKNIIGFKEDKKRKYNTVMTLFKNGKNIMAITIVIGLCIILLTPIIFNLKMNLASIIFIIITTLFLISHIIRLEGEKATNLARLVIVSILFSYLIVNQVHLIFMGIFMITGFHFINEGTKTLFYDLKHLNSNLISAI